MKISFLVTYYNQEQYVRQSMDSILAIEKPQEWEILVGDDGSSDGTVEIVNEYISKYPQNVKLFIMPRDKTKQYYPVKRASENRINLLEHCTGDFFCTLDGDDFFFDTKFVKEALDILENNSDISLVSFGYRYFKNGILGKEMRLPKGVGQRVDRREYISKRYLHAGSAVYKIMWDQSRIEFIKAIGYFDDNDIVMNSLNYGQMYYIDRCIYAYRQTDESVYNSMGSIEQAILNVQGLDIDRKLLEESVYEELVNRNVSSILKMYIWKNKLEKAIGGKKYNIYSDSSRQIENSLAYKLLTFSNLNHETKKSIRRMVYGLAMDNPILYAKTLAKFYIKRN